MSTSRFHFLKVFFPFFFFFSPYLVVHTDNPYIDLDNDNMQEMLASKVEYSNHHLNNWFVHTASLEEMQVNVQIGVHEKKSIDMERRRERKWKQNSRNISIK